MNTRKVLPSSIIEYSIDGGATWQHGKTIEAWVAADAGHLRAQRGHVIAAARDWHGDVERVITRVLAEDDPRAEVNRMPDAKFFAVRQARTRVIGSRVMTRAEAELEVTVWLREIGPAAVVPVTDELTHAVRVYDQDMLRAVLYAEDDLDKDDDSGADGYIQPI
jgi:hypothetical protein